MTSIFDMAPALLAYQPAFLVIGILIIVMLAQNFLTAPLAFIHEEQVPGMPLQHDHSRLSFRALRTHANSVEAFPAFAWALLLAVTAGASAPWVNGLAIAFLVFRLLFWAIYYAGFGKITGGPRTLAFVGGLLANFGLAGLALFSLVI